MTIKHAPGVVCITVARRPDNAFTGRVVTLAAQIAAPRLAYPELTNTPWWTFEKPVVHPKTGRLITRAPQSHLIPIAGPKVELVHEKEADHVKA